MWVVDVFGFIRTLVIIPVQPGEEERDGHADLRVIEVIRAAVDVVVSGPVDRIVELVVERQRFRLLAVDALDRLAKILRIEKRTHDADVVVAAAGEVFRATATDHVDVDLRDDRIDRHRWIGREEG